jgi:hypothetical protein
MSTQRDVYTCSKCGNSSVNTYDFIWVFCPFCGNKYDLKYDLKYEETKICYGCRQPVKMEFMKCPYSFCGVDPS